MLRANKFENLVNSYNCVYTDVEMKSLAKEQVYIFRKERIIVSDRRHNHATSAATSERTQLESRQDATVLWGVWGY